MTRAIILGCAGPALTDGEAAFFRDADPWGFIVFGRNVVSPDQLRALTAALRDAVGRDDAPVFVDQEGGRVARLGPPHWPRFPPAARFGALAVRDPEGARDTAWLGGRLIAHELAAVGITADCAPVLDVPAPEGHAVIGDRAFAADPDLVADLAGAWARGLMAGGVAPVVKHIPGHGRAVADSHRELPVVDATLAELEAVDFRPFRRLAGLPMAMTAHVVFAAIDRRAPATVSRRVLDEIVRGAIGFDGLLMSDDLSMQALEGSIGQRARATFGAGCDIALHCNGDPAEMADVAAAAPRLEGAAAERARRAMAAVAGGAESFDLEDARRRFAAAFDASFAA